MTRGDPVVENLARYAANRLERGNVAAQNRLQVLVKMNRAQIRRE